MRNTTMRTPILHEAQNLTQLALPVMLAQVLRIFISVFAVYFVGKLGPLYLAANSLVMTVQLIFLLFAMGCSMATGIVIGRHFGAQDHKAIAKTFASGLWMAIFIGIPTVILFTLVPYALPFLGQKHAIVDLTYHYFMLLGCALPLFYLLFTGQQLLIGISKPRFIYILALLGLTLNIVFYKLFIFGFSFFPAMKLNGIGLSALLAGSISLITMFWHFKSHALFKPYVQLSLMKQIDWQEIKMLFSIGWPIGMSMTVEIIALSIIVLMIGVLGKDALSAYQITWQVMIVVTMIPYAMSQAVSIAISQHYGRQQSERIFTTGILGILISLSIVACFSVAFLITPHWFAHWFIQPHQEDANIILNLTTVLFGISALMILFDSIRLTCVGGLRGLKIVKPPLVITLICYWAIGLPAAAILGFVCHFGAPGLWWGLAMSIVLSGTLTFGLFWHKSNAL